MTPCLRGYISMCTSPLFILNVIQILSGLSLAGSSSCRGRKCYVRPLYSSLAGLINSFQHPATLLCVG